MLCDTPTLRPYQLYAALTNTPLHYAFAPSKRSRPRPKAQSITKALSSNTTHTVLFVFVDPDSKPVARIDVKALLKEFQDVIARRALAHARTTAYLHPIATPTCDVIEAFLEGRATQDELIAAKDKAWTAANATNSAANAANATWAAAYAANATWAAAYAAANSAANAANAAANAAAWAAWAAATAANDTWKQAHDAEYEWMDQWWEGRIAP